VLDADEAVPRLAARADDLVELGLHGRGVSVLRVLDQEDHEEGDDGGGRVHHELPGVGVAEDRPCDRPHEDEAERGDEGFGLAREAGDAGGDGGEEAFHTARFLAGSVAADP
jgi:hypothetical protein